MTSSMENYFHKFAAAIIFTEMADNYLEKKMEAYRERQAAEQKARQAAWKKRMDVYRKRLSEKNPVENGKDVPES